MAVSKISQVSMIWVTDMPIFNATWQECQVIAKAFIQLPFVPIHQLTRFAYPEKTDKHRTEAA